MRDPRKTTIAIDFDGVLYPVLPTAAPALRHLRGMCKLWVFTARRDHDAVKRILRDHDLWRYFEGVTSEKGRFDMIVDDMKLVQFTGDWEPVLRAAQEL